jgi:site-specific DNA-methyltransferase (adenine-specific)
MAGNRLYYGDNLEVMRAQMADESVDLIYLDPPFNSARDYNVLFKQAKKDENQAQIVAFEDTWQWSKRHYDEFFDDVSHARLFDLMTSLHRILGNSEMMAYLVMMAPRLLQMHRVLKPTGSLYLHCDPTASHYLKLLLDMIFGPIQFRNEVIWKRTTSHNDAKKYADIHDVILYYSKGSNIIWNPLYIQQSEKYLKTHYNRTDSQGRVYRLDNIIRSASMGPRPNLAYQYKNYTPKWGWRVVRDKLEKLDKDGRIEWSANGIPYLVRYLDEMKGTTMPSIWDDIPPVNSQAQERMGYPTQKPLTLLERIITASSNPGDVVFDPFCGCGTAVVAAEKLGRGWLGIDVTFIAVDLMIARLARDFGLRREVDYKVIGDPKDNYSARKLFEQSPKQFEVWAVGLVQGVPQPDKVGDRGVDGKVYFQDLDGQLQFAIVQIKGGHLTPGLIRDFAHVIDREKAALGFFISLETPTKGMHDAADELGFFTAPSGRKIPRMQLRTIKELLDEGKPFDFPVGYQLKSGSGKQVARAHEQVALELGE